MTKPNEQAFPFNEAVLGLSKREYFATQALIGLLGRNEVVIEYAITEAVKVADQLIETLNKNNGE